MTVQKFNELLKNINNPECFNMLYAEYYPQLIKISLHLYGNLENAEDVAQEIFKYLLTHKSDTYVNTPEAWLYALCKYNGQKLFKREISFDESIKYDAPIKQYISLDMKIALSKLTEEEADIIILFWYNGYSLKEISKILHKSYAAVAKQHEKIKKKLKTFLSV